MTSPSCRRGIDQRQPARGSQESCAFCGGRPTWAVTETVEIEGEEPSYSTVWLCAECDDREIAALEATDVEE